jgi:hypothetical protein
MSEWRHVHHCETCGTQTSHLMSGSGRYAICEYCNTTTDNHEEYESRLAAISEID